LGSGDKLAAERVHVAGLLSKRRSTMNVVLKATTQFLPSTTPLMAVPEASVEPFTTFTLKPEDSSNPKSPDNMLKHLGLGNTVITSPLANAPSAHDTTVEQSRSAAARAVVHTNPLTRKR
jgi:hypothetical protein